MVCNVVVTQELGGRWGGWGGEVGDCWCWLNRHPWQCFGITPQYSRFNATGATKMLEIYNGLDRHMRQCSGPGGEVCETHWWHPESTKVFTAPPSSPPTTPHCDIYLPIQGLWSSKFVTQADIYWLIARRCLFGNGLVFHPMILTSTNVNTDLEINISIFSHTVFALFRAHEIYQQK